MPIFVEIPSRTFLGNRQNTGDYFVALQRISAHQCLLVEMHGWLTSYLGCQLVQTALFASLD